MALLRHQSSSTIVELVLDCLSAFHLDMLSLFVFVSVLVSVAFGTESASHPGSDILCHSQDRVVDTPIDRQCSTPC